MDLHCKISLNFIAFKDNILKELIAISQMILKIYPTTRIETRKGVKMIRIVRRVGMIGPTINSS